LWIVVLLITGLSAGCSLPPAGTPLSGGVSTPTAGYSVARPAGLADAPVEHIVDGDTVDILLNGRSERVRLIGVDTPETVDPRRPVECFGREASAFTAALLAGQTVGVELDPTQGERDRYGRLLAYLWLADGRLVNYELIAQGYAHEYTYDLPYKYQIVFKDAQRRAREGEVGLWGPTACAALTATAAASTPALATAPAATAAATAPGGTASAGTPRANCDPAYPDVCIPPPPPDLSCANVPYRSFRVLPPDPHGFDGNRDGVGCER
jgi:micrococcal nuclease